MSFDPQKTISPCPICSVRANVYSGNGDNLIVQCEKCGDFVAAGSLGDDWSSSGGNDKKKVALASYVIRSLQKGGMRPKLTTYGLNEYLKNRELPTPPEATTNLLLLVGEELRYQPGNFSSTNLLAATAIIGAIDKADAIYHARVLQDEGLGTWASSQSEVGIRLSYGGWQKYHELIRARQDSKFAFFARKFDSPELDNVFANCFFLAVHATGYELRKVPQRAGLIDAIIENEIRNCKFLVAEMSDNNAGAYWEAGFAEGLGKPVIYVCKEGVKTHFDTEHRHTIPWHPEKLDETAMLLKAVIRNTLLGDAKQTDD